MPNELPRHVPDAGAEALALLDPARGPIEAPIRSEIFGAARFAQHGKSLADVHSAKVGAASPTFFPRLRQNIEALREAHDYIGQQERKVDVDPAGDWLLDNFHVVVAQIKEIHEGLPRRYFRDLPVLMDAHLAGLPRIYGVAWAFVAHTDSAFDETLLLEFLNAYQQTRPLNLGELWALPTTLRVVLIENLRRLAEGVATTMAAREIANLWCDRLETERDEDVDELFKIMNARGVLQPFALQVMARQRSDFGSELAEDEQSRAKIRAALDAAIPDPAIAQTQQHTEQAAANLSLSNTITSLRLLGDIAWRSLIARTSVLMHEMQRSSAFEDESNDTQDATLRAIERLAERCGQSELTVARKVVESIQTASAAATAGSRQDLESPSYWVRGPGRASLRRAFGVRAFVFPEWARWRRWALPAYLTTMVLGTVCLTHWFVTHHAFPSAHLWRVLITLFALLPASEAVIAIVNRLISESVPPRRLPRLALTDGIPAEHRVLVVVPSMLTGSAEIHTLAQRLERHYLANSERHAQFALLTDYADADEMSSSGDAGLLDEAIAAIDALEAAHRHPDAPRRFLLLHRERRWSESEHRWIGWERKRGKLMQLIDWLAAGGPSPFVDLGDRSRPLDGTAYVVTLDSDTQLPPRALHQLVAVAAHPANRPRIEPTRRRVIGGFGILQPRVVTPLPTRTVTPFHWLFAGQSGIDPYSAATSEVYQDLFDEGTFTGKGLLDVHALHAVLSNRLPEDQVLSHDLIEGSIARCGGVSDVTLIEDAPMHADVAAARVHRWTRGDWQLLPVLFSRRNRYGLRTIDRWKLFDNLRRSLVAPCAVALIITALWGGPVPTLAALALAFAAFGGGPLLGALAGLAPGRDDVALGHFYRQALTNIARALGAALWGMVQLLQQSMLLVDAIARAIYRSAVSHRRLLQWTTTAATHSLAEQNLADITRRHAPVTVAAVLLLVAALLLHTPSPILAVVLCSIWACAPLWTWWASRPRLVHHYAEAVGQEREYLLGVAQDSWRLFERYVGPDTHHLPPDNVQTTPHTMVANRTSPTNIGLYLLTVNCARCFGWIDTAQMLTRCEQTFATLAQLPRHRGHFLNWYDTSTLAVLQPAYVSTVDSGNLCGHLIAVAGACRELIPVSTDDEQSRLRAIAHTCHELAMAAEFGFLFDRRRRLFHIGYRVAEQHLDKSFYDLFASESRLASLWAIAKCDVPVNHWAALGRTFYAVGRDAGLRSWSGSMFEYLMPSLVLEEPRDSALGSAARAAIHEQIVYAHVRGVPWGMSESAYAASDHTLAYQYAPQGVPRLALRRTPLDELVVAPYATALAAMYDPVAAVKNFRRLEGMRARAEMGFVEALDFTPDRQTNGSTFVRVETFMAHHQGMTIIALANALLGGAPRRWAMRDPRVSAVASLLQERVPQAVSRLLEPPPGHARHSTRDGIQAATTEVAPDFVSVHPTHLLSNGRYCVALRANGAGWSRLGGIDLSRWRDNVLRDAYGTFFYLKRADAASLVSITEHPAPDDSADYQATFHSDRVHFDAQWPDLRTRCTVWVSPEDDVELRRIEMWSTSSKPITLDLISMFEVTLTDARADEMHPVFANMFVTADWDAQGRALYFYRNPRLEHEAGLHAVHFIAQTDNASGAVRAQTDRATWLGRNREPSQPLGNFGPLLGSGPCATGLDPIAALSTRIVIPAHGSVFVTFGTAAASSRDVLDSVVDRYRQTLVIERAALMSTTLAVIRRRELGIHPDEMRAIQTITTMLTLLVSRPQGDANEATYDRRALWRFGISGDRALIVVEAMSARGVGLVRALVRALRWWSWGGVVCDLVVIDNEQSSYQMPLKRELLSLREQYLRDVGSVAPAGPCTLHFMHKDEVGVEEHAALAALPRLRFFADGRPLAQHVQDLIDWHDQALVQRRAQGCVSLTSPEWTSAGHAPHGQFDAVGRFRFTVDGPNRPARPWINVLANENFGAQISEAGSGYSWAGNSRLHQLTAWSNDPVADPSGESFWLQDVRTRETWGVGAGSSAAHVGYTIEHGQGHTTIRHRRGDLDVATTWCVDTASSVKHVRISVRNVGTRARRIRVIGAFDWVMGEKRSDRQSVRTAWKSSTIGGAPRIDVLLCTQCDAHSGFGGSTAFVAIGRDGAEDAQLDDWTCDRRELFDLRGRRVVPHAFGKHAGARLDPCAAASVTLSLEPGYTQECVFLLGHGNTADDAHTLARTALAMNATQRERSVRARWDELLGPVTVQTPDPLFDVLVNRWLIYQALGCRLWARAGFYQAGGAFGFRDQLQDAMALAVTAPQLLQRQLLLCASRQFVEGDVQHWWHPPGGAGVRTRFRDDLLWLPYATVHYVDVTGDSEILDKVVPFLDGEQIPADAEDAYFVPHISDTSATLYEHCARTLDRSLDVGAHGLPLMGSGDWNDGLNRVGYPGRGESVWLGWFLCTIVATFAPLARERNDTERAERWETAAHGWRDALRNNAWDGEWFVRAFFDDGTPLGAKDNDECRIDLVAQTWAVLSDVATPAQQQAAMAAVAHLLIDDANGLVRMLDPPLTRAKPDPGYIGAYPPGVRENGSQYSHAGVWALMAQAALGNSAAAYRTFTRLSPAHRSAHAQQSTVYQLEPYVMAGDVYSQPPYVGRGGWSWYTGSAAWLHRGALESICGFRVRGGRISLTPRLPPHWPRIQIRLRQGDRTHEFIVCAAWAKDEIDKATANGAVPLPESEWLELASVGNASRHLIITTGRVFLTDSEAHVESPSEVGP